MNTPESEARGEVAEYPLPEDLERDGIGEDDHAIPAWFNVGFYGGLVFGVAYILYYSLSSWTSLGEYEAEVARAEALAKANAPAVATANPFLEDATALAEGKQVFTTVCAACHKPDGSGLVGPSLVDPYWKYGDSDTEKYVSVAEGRPLGMPAWLSQLGSEKIWKAIAYADSLPRTDAPGVGAPDYVPPTPGGS